MAASIPRFKSLRAIVGRIGPTATCERSKANKPSCGLWDCLNEAWNNIPPQTLRKLIVRMSKLCAAVIEAKGDHFQENRLK